MPRDLGSRWSFSSGEVVRRNRRSVRARLRIEGLEDRALLSVAGAGEPDPVPPGFEGLASEVSEAIGASLPPIVTPEGPETLGLLAPATAFDGPRVVIPAASLGTPVAQLTLGNSVSALDEALELLKTSGQHPASGWLGGPHQAASLASSTEWVVTEFLRESLTPEGMDLPGGVFFEPAVQPPSPMGTVTTLPGGGPVTMVGTIRYGEAPDYYAIRPEGDAFRVRFTAFDPTSDLADLMVLMDGDGALIVGCTISATENTVTIDIRAVDGSFEEEVILRIGPDGPRQGDGLEAYALTVLPTPSSAGEEHFSPGDEPLNGDPNPPAPSGVSPVPTSPPGWTGRDPLPVPWGAGSSAVVEVAPTTTSPVAMDEGAATLDEPRSDALGPLPALAAAPFGGILGLGAPAQSLGRHEAAVIDLELIDVPRPEALDPQPVDPGLAAELAEAAPEDVDGHLALPALAAAHPRVTLEGIPPELLEAVATAPVQVALGPTAAVGEPGAVAAPDPGPGKPSEPEPPAQPRTLRWTVAGLTALMAAHLLLPDLGLLVPMGRARRRGRRRGLGDLLGSWCRPPRSIG